MLRIKISITLIFKKYITQSITLNTVKDSWTQNNYCIWDTIIYKRHILNKFKLSKHTLKYKWLAIYNGSHLNILCSYNDKWNAMNWTFTWSITCIMHLARQPIFATMLQPQVWLISPAWKTSGRLGQTQRATSIMTQTSKARIADTNDEKSSGITNNT